MNRKPDDMDQSTYENFLERIEFSDREEEVLKHLVLGYSDKEIARHIDISPRTVGRYVEMVRFKLRARNRTHVIKRAINAGLLKLA